MKNSPPCGLAAELFSFWMHKLVQQYFLFISQSLGRRIARSIARPLDRWSTIIVHASTMLMVHVSRLTGLVFDAIQVWESVGRSPRGKHGGLRGRQGPQCLASQSFPSSSFPIQKSRYAGLQNRQYSLPAGWLGRGTEIKLQGSSVKTCLSILEILNFFQRKRSIAERRHWCTGTSQRGV